MNGCGWHCSVCTGTGYWYTGTTVESVVEAGRRRWTWLEEVHTPPLLGRSRKVELEAKENKVVRRNQKTVSVYKITTRVFTNHPLHRPLFAVFWLFFLSNLWQTSLDGHHHFYPRNVANPRLLLLQ